VKIHDIDVNFFISKKNTFKLTPAALLLKNTQAPRAT